MHLHGDGKLVAAHREFGFRRPVEAAAMIPGVEQLVAISCVDDPAQFLVVNLLQRAIFRKDDAVIGIFDHRRRFGGGFFRHHRLQPIHGHHRIAKGRNIRDTLALQDDPLPAGLRRGIEDHQPLALTRYAAGQSIHGCIRVMLGDLGGLLHPIPMLHPGFCHIPPIVLAYAVGVLVIHDQIRPGAIEIRRRIGCPGIQRRQRGQFFRRRQLSIRIQALGQHIRCRQSVQRPTIGDIAPQDGDLIAEALPHQIKGLIGIAQRANLRPGKPGIPLGDGVGKTQLRGHIVLVIFHQPNIVGIFLFHQGQMLAHTGINALHRAAKGADAEALTAHAILRRCPNQHFPIRLALPVKQHGQGRLIPHIDPGATAAGFRVIHHPNLAGIQGPGLRQMGAPVVGSKNDVFNARIRIGLHHGPGQTRHIDHGHSLARDALLFQPAAAVGAAAQFFHAIAVDMVARHAGAHAQLAIPDHFDGVRRLCFAISLAIIVPGPGALKHIAILGLLRPVRRLTAQLFRLIEETGTFLPLNIGRSVQADIQMGGNHGIDRPLSRRRIGLADFCQLIALAVGNDPAGRKIGLRRLHPYGCEGTAAV